MKQLTTKMLRQRKMLLVLPVLVVPFITMAFWALGGGKGSADESAKNSSGLILELPGAALKNDETMDKMAYYERAESDSEKIIQQLKEDPYFIKQPLAADSILAAFSEKNTTLQTSKNQLPGNLYGYTGMPYEDPNETKVYQKLAQLNNVLKTNNSLATNEAYTTNPFSKTETETTNTDQLEQMLHTNGGNKTEDPEMNQLNGMLEKILDIQHPERVNEKLKKTPFKQEEPVYAVSSEMYKASFSLIDTPVTAQLPSPAESFFGIKETVLNGLHNSVEAVIHENQTLVSGSIIKLRLCTSVYINEQLVPSGSFVFGTVTLNKERLEISINSIRQGNSIYPVKMEVYDMDGLAGVFIPGAITRDVIKQSGDNALQSVTFGTLDPSLGAQAASAGIETAKNLLSKKVKLIKVQVKAGYKILLKDNQ